MKKWYLRLAALCLSITMLAGCSLEGVKEALRNQLPPPPAPEVVHFDDMVYTRPDMAELEETLENACKAAKKDDLDRIDEAILEFYAVYDEFYTCYALADIHYCKDMTNSEWEEEYQFCLENSPAVDAALEELYYALAKSPCLDELESDDYFGEGYFDSYQGDNNWDEEFVTLLEEEAGLVDRYYDLSAQGLEYDPYSEEFYTNCGNEMLELLVELIGQRQKIAAAWGYDNYSEFAWDFYHYRDYTPDQTETYLAKIQSELVSLYRDFYENGLGVKYKRCSEKQTYRYVKDVAEAMGGKVAEAFALMDEAGLCDNAYGENKYDGSFEIYLEKYRQPYVFLNPTGYNYDYLMLAHEFGHFCNDYVSFGSYAGVDVMEIFSQGMEYLSLCYTEDAEDLTKIKMEDSLCTFVEQAAFASFEMQMYRLTGDDLTVENLRSLYDQVARDYGFDSYGYDDREFVTINHLFESPMYIISYVVSNDAAMQLYQLEQEKSGAGLELYEKYLDTTESYFLAFVEDAGLESPFADGRMEDIKKTFEQILK